MSILVCSKAPPGGRCQLYIAFAEVLAGALNVPSVVVYDAEEAGVEAPALLIAGRVVEPEDGFMLTPDDIVSALRDRGVLAEAGLLSALQAAEEKLMEAER